ncbi:hypothetical protein [Roseibium sp.]|uniref:hypothetical protein n=1 Tax=Roseibium sp. TaxID=1936156 RepID=UPI003D1356C2
MADTTFGPKGWTPARLGDQSGKTYIITGANAGAGFQAARMLLKKNAKVVMLNRSAGKSEAAWQRRTPIVLSQAAPWRALLLSGATRTGLAEHLARRNSHSLHV